MRYVTISNLKKGMLLARNLYNEKFKIAFKEGAKLKNSQVETIKKMGYPGVYVLDEGSDEVVAELIVPEEDHLFAVESVAKYLQQASAPGSHMLKVSLDEQRRVVMPIVEALKKKPSLIIDVIDIKPYDGYNHYHAAMVMILSLCIGIKMGLNDEQLFELGIAALLHDIGNAFIPMDILNRPGRLTDEEFDVIKQHVKMGHDYLLNSFSLPESASLGAMQHHENYDGTGYPGGLRRKNISLYGRIIAITDVYDALVSKRSFRAAMYPVQALEIVQQHADRKFDPDVVETLEKVVAPFPVGTMVQLKNGEEFLVARNFADNLKKPIIQEYDGRRKGHQTVDMRVDPEYSKIRIVKIVDA